jgi:hypothetical protein
LSDVVIASADPAAVLPGTSCCSIQRQDESNERQEAKANEISRDRAHHFKPKEVAASIGQIDIGLRSSGVLNGILFSHERS